jgi:DNA (cytosine-5)-methyltransferase 1
MKRQLRYIDLFAGCGGLSLGLYKAGWKGVFAIEKSNMAFSTLKANLIDSAKHFEWPDWLDQSPYEIDNVIEEYRDQLKELRGTIDLIAGGPPCQGFSSAGRRQEDDVRNGLVNSYLEFVRLVQPKCIFFENVKGFTLKFQRNKSKGLIYANYVVEKLNQQGYSVYGKLVDFSKYGLPQKRTRFILVGIRKEIAENRKIVVKNFFRKLNLNRRPFFKMTGLPANPNLGSAISDLLRSNGTIPTPDRKGFLTGNYSAPKSKYQKSLRKGVRLQYPDSHSFAKHRLDIEKRFEYLIKVGEGRNISNKIRTELNLNKYTIVPLSAKCKTQTITSLPDDCIHYSEPRILTVREYARIQGFPDWYEFKGKYTTGGPVRKIQVPRYTQIGNAIPPIFSEQCGIILKQLVL